jgi:erythronate-4-phosphate dehydrogenase
MNHRLPTIVVNKNTPMVVEVFSRLGNVIALDTPEVTKEAVRDADILIVRSETDVDSSLLEGTGVRFVGTLTIGTDHIDLDYLTSRGIRFASAPGSNSNSVAEYLAAALLVWCQRTGEPLRGKLLGIVGVGNVGSKVVRVARALEMDVVLNDPPLARETGDPSYRPLDELMDADFVTLHVPLTRTGPDATYHLFAEERLKKMKRGSVLINTARGAVVEKSALRDALSSGNLSAAILDVWEGEPRIDTGLLDLVMIGTPHIAGYSLDGKLNALRMVYEQVCQYLQVGAEWSDGLTPPPSASERIVVPQSITVEREIVAFAIRQAYDIELDDYMLRRVVSMPETERGRYFMRLRAEYRTRREFFNRVVELSPEQKSTSAVLNELGFMTEVRKELQWVR